jgi:hypothetical protein
VKRALQAVEMAVSDKPFNGLYVPAFASHGEGDAGGHRVSVDQDRASAAFAAVAAGFDTGQANDIAQIFDEQLVLGDGILAPPAVDGQPEQSLDRPWLCRFSLHERASPPGKSAPGISTHWSSWLRSAFQRHDQNQALRPRA